MFATIITTTLFRAGFKAAYLANPAPKPGPVEPIITLLREFDPARFETAAALYVPTLDRCVEVGEDGWPEDETTGLLTADVLMIEHLQEVAPHSEPWVVDFMGEGSWEDVKNAAPEIHAIVAQSFAAREEHEQKKYEQRVRNYSPETISPREPELDYHCEFIGLWEAETSLDWESGHTEIDAINFVGEGSIVPVKPNPVPPELPLTVEEEIIRASMDG
jgi:hypothetical protein